MQCLQFTGARQTRYCHEGFDWRNYMPWEGRWGVFRINSSPPFGICRFLCFMFGGCLKGSVSVRIERASCSPIVPSRNRIHKALNRNHALEFLHLLLVNKRADATSHQQCTIVVMPANMTFSFHQFLYTVCNLFSLILSFCLSLSDTAQEWRLIGGSFLIKQFNIN